MRGIFGERLFSRIGSRNRSRTQVLRGYRPNMEVEPEELIRFHVASTRFSYLYRRVTSVLYNAYTYTEYDDV
jgi:hypothetical protein